MSFEDIAHLDFTLDDAADLRERALAAWERERDARRHALLLLAQECLHEILDLMNAHEIKVELAQTKGEGTVDFRVGTLSFRVRAIKGGESAALNVKIQSGFRQIVCLADLGRCLEEGLCATA